MVAKMARTSAFLSPVGGCSMSGEVDSSNSAGPTRRQTAKQSGAGWEDYDAVGVRMTELPITPERLLKALAEQRGEV